MKLYRQGDVLFQQLAKLPAGESKRRDNGVVAYGEATGHAHALREEDCDVAEVLEIDGGLYVHVSESGLSLRGGATFVHAQHEPVTLPPGDYQVVIQREYTPKAIRHVTD